MNRFIIILHRVRACAARRSAVQSKRQPRARRPIARALPWPAGALLCRLGPAGRFSLANSRSWLKRQSGWLLLGRAEPVELVLPLAGHVGLAEGVGHLDQRSWRLDETVCSDFGRDLVRPGH